MDSAPVYTVYKVQVMLQDILVTHTQYSLVAPLQGHVGTWCCAVALPVEPVVVWRLLCPSTLHRKSTQHTLSRDFIADCLLHCCLTL